MIISNDILLRRLFDMEKRHGAYNIISFFFLSDITNWPCFMRFLHVLRSLTYFFLEPVCYLNLKDNERNNNNSFSFVSVAVIV